MGTWLIRLLQKYWSRLTMVSKSVGYHGPPFKYFRRMTQVNLLSPTIFNVIVDSVVQHWVTVVAEGGVGSEGLRHSIQRM